MPSLLGVGVALPGPLDHVRGVLHRVTGFPGWDGFPLREALEERLGVPVVVDKDTNAAALGIAVGGEQGSFAYLHLGTGLGAGLVIGGVCIGGADGGGGVRASGDSAGRAAVRLRGRGCIEALCLGAVARGELGEAARVLGAGAANLAGLLDIDLVLLGVVRSSGRRRCSWVGSGLCLVLGLGGRGCGGAGAGCCGWGC
ncbi:hypothetical protein SHKM778_82260 [Streptomyces sp. KM77-8]|uniref:ROK family protein n=1 Tax=Streptomyces haneummycinicus TaxID=3074435 RepID=A0AAT9HXB1_9ACTN